MKPYPSVHHLTFFAVLLSSTMVAGEDLLGGDDFAFDSSALEVNEPHWSDGFKTTLDHSHTQIAAEPNRQQSSLRIEYEGNLAEGWYLKLNTRYRYFWHDDDLAEDRGDAYGINKWQHAWLQYSRGACTAKAGRQVLIWGEVEGTFVTDIITPFDYTEQLLTDYGNVRLAQDMLVGQCFFENSQLQAFYTPKARSDIYQHHRLLMPLAPGLPALNLDAEGNEEMGLRFKWVGSGYDVSLMYARLYDNTPTPVPDATNLPPFHSELARFDMLGVSTSIARGRLLIKAEAAFRNHQAIALSSALTARYDAALGLEYTTIGNHVLNGGIWATHYTNYIVQERDIQVLTAGWRKTYLNDNLTMSLLGNGSSSPRFVSVTILAEYQWDDYWNTAIAVTIADLSQVATPIPIIPAEESTTVSIKYEF